MTNARFDPRSLAAPIVAAPMAGGPSTPELAAAVGRAGGLGFLAAGYLPPDSLARQVGQARAHGVPFGVNVFVPEPRPRTEDDRAALRAYARALAPIAERLGVAVGEPEESDDHWDAKIALLLEDPVPVVSFTFGFAPTEVIAALRERGTAVWASVATAPDAALATASGVDALVIQGPDAGGHRATRSMGDEPGTLPLTDLLAGCAAVTDLPLIAAGGIADAAGVQRVQDAGAVAAQVGTGFLLADEAGTSPTHRAALTDPAFTETALTRAFSGRPARGLANALMRDPGPLAPALYPDVNAMTAPLRRAAAAAGDPSATSLWAGSGWRHARAAPAARIVAELTPAAPVGPQ